MPNDFKKSHLQLLIFNTHAHTHTHTHTHTEREREREREREMLSMEGSKNKLLCDFETKHAIKVLFNQTM